MTRLTNSQLTIDLPIIHKRSGQEATIMQIHRKDKLVRVIVSDGERLSIPFNIIVKEWRNNSPLDNA